MADPVDELVSALAGAKLESAPSAEPALRCGLVFSAELEKHVGPEDHPECPARHRCVVARLQETGLAGSCVLLEPRPATDTELLRAHSAEHLRSVASFFDAAGPAVQSKGDLFYCQSTETAARLSAGCAVAAVEAVCSGKVATAFAVIRPPGHHAECDRAQGFCFYNNASVAALAALEQPGVARVLILDWDVHHGNGIEAIHYADPRILYVSLHRFGDTPSTWFYPGTGAAEDCGTGPGLGFNVNVPWPERNLGDADYMAAFELVIDPIGRAFAPDLVIISAGFDAALGDPLGNMRLTEEAYHRMTAACMAMAKDGRCVALLEGGYNVSVIGGCAAATVTGLQGVPPPSQPLEERPKRVTEATLRKVIARQEAHWPCLATPEARAAVDACFPSITPQKATPKKKASVKAPATPPLTPPTHVGRRVKVLRASEWSEAVLSDFSSSTGRHEVCYHINTPLEAREWLTLAQLETAAALEWLPGDAAEELRESRATARLSAR